MKIERALTKHDGLDLLERAWIRMYEERVMPDCLISTVIDESVWQALAILNDLARQVAEEI